MLCSLLCKTESDPFVPGKEWAKGIVVGVDDFRNQGIGEGVGWDVVGGDGVVFGNWFILVGWDGAAVVSGNWFIFVVVTNRFITDIILTIFIISPFVICIIVIGSLRCDNNRFRVISPQNAHCNIQSKMSQKRQWSRKLSIRNHFRSPNEIGKEGIVIGRP